MEVVDNNMVVAILGESTIDALRVRKISDHKIQPSSPPQVALSGLKIQRGNFFYGMSLRGNGIGYTALEERLRLEADAKAGSPTAWGNWDGIMGISGGKSGMI